ncbi:PREDICTED: uncharacterized protein C17orf53 homolog isoform X1 [Chinchilla lanigera]|uniref:uncharacterized protein C17orf53 homolog isoform X1 n=1 Tax=Chinchilla lanigera TaxID=34839 RepID=UPI00038EBBAA|nr:PREDICTED: uncharacterized protein C17orf53 homolog isoform X1 [Chinchilla lanigera]
MHQHRPEPAGPRLESGPGAPCGRDSSAPPAVPSEACGPWTLFSVDEDFEDEDFLSAVEDAENQLAGAPPGPAGHLQPVSPSLQAPSPSPPALHPSAALAAQCPPALRLCPAAPDVPRAIRDPPRPHLTSSNWMGSQRTEGTWGALAKDDLDEVLASLELGLGAGARGPAPAKRARVLDLSELTSRPVAALPLQDPPAPTGPQRTPRPLLRPGATWAGATPPGQLPRPLGTSSGGPCHGSPLPPPLACAGSKPRPAGLQAPGACAPATPGTGRAASPRLPPAPRAPAASPVGTPRGPHFSLQTPVVTNHLLQLVTAATRTPAYTRTRRFPGPAGLLPQHGGKNPEEIVVSTPQTPAHGALAKLRVEATVTSSQALAEEDFGRGPWLAMKAALGLDEGDPACFLHTCSVAMVLRKAALKQLPGNKVPTMAVLVKSLTRSTVDASVVLRDPTGEMQGTVHRALLEARRGALRPGAVLLLRQVGVFSPSPRNHYLNVTPSNLVHVYSPDSGGQGLLGPPQPVPQGPGSPRGRRQADVAPEEEGPDADDLDGLLSELPEDLFSGGGGSGQADAGLP